MVKAKSNNEFSFESLPNNAIRIFWLAVILFVSYGISKEIFVRIKGVYTLGIVRERTQGRGAWHVTYEYNVDDKNYRKSKEQALGNVPEPGEYFVIKYLKNTPQTASPVWSKLVPPCFQYGQTYSGLNCP